MANRIIKGRNGLLLVGAILALGTSSIVYPLYAKDKEAPAAAGAPQAAPVTVAKPLVQPISQWREFSGRFDASETVDIRSRVSGYLTSINFTDGAIVKKGDLLFVIDPRQFEAALRQKQADLNLAKSQVSAAQNDYDRALALFKSGDVSAQLLDQRKATRDSAVASVDSAKAAVDSARVDVVYTKIQSPITGRIGRKLVTEGNLVNPGQDVLTTIVAMDPIYFYFDVDEQTYLQYARKTTGQANTNENPGIPVMVALTDEKEYTHKGTLDFIDNSLSTGTGTIRARAVLSNADMFLTPGMFGRVRIQTGQSDTGVLIPDSAVMIDQSRKKVYVVGANNVVESRTVETGQIDRGLRVITKGLTGDDTVIINGLQRAHEGAPVAPEQGQITATDENAPAPVTDTTAPDQASAAEKAKADASPQPATQPEDQKK